MKRKGIVFTTGLVLLSVSVLLLAVVSITQLSRMHKLEFDAAASERAFDEFNSVGEDLSGIVGEASGVKVSVDGSTVTFNETIPNPKAVSYKNTLDLYAAFVGGNTDNLALDLNHTRNVLTLVVRPNETNYTHDSFGGGEIRVNPAQIAFSKYSVRIDSVENITDCAWTVPSGNNTIELEVAVNGNPGSCTDSVMVDPSQESFVDVNAGSVSVLVGAGGRLVVENDFSTAVNVSTAVFFSGDSDTLLGVYLPSGIVVESLPEHQVSKEGYIKMR